MRCTIGRQRTILVSAKIAASANHGGWTWAVLQYLLGLRRLGHRVFLLESIEAKALRPAGDLRSSDNARYFRRVMADFELTGCLWLRGTDQTVGLSRDGLRAVMRQADVLLNVSGSLRDWDDAERIPVRVYLDLDPAFTQIWALQGTEMGFIHHTHFVTLAQTLGQKGCPIPTCGFEWIPTVQPMALDAWPAASYVTLDAFTTVANWRGSGSVTHENVFYGQKAHSLRCLINLPNRTDAQFALALGIHADEQQDIDALRANKWALIDPRSVAATPQQFQGFVQGSAAEFAFAKSGYVTARCGWFSDRSACYLASGRPVLAQDTGFGSFLPVGEGLLSFRTVAEAAEGAERIRRDYPRHAAAARRIAETCFDSDRVLGRLLRNVGVVP